MNTNKFTMSVETIVEFPNFIRDFLVVGAFLAFSIVVGFYLYKKISDKRDKDIVILKVTLIIAITVISIVIMSHIYTIEAEVTTASLEDWETENVEIVKYYEDQTSEDHKIDLQVDYRNISSVTATTTNGEILDTQEFPGVSNGTLNIEYHIKEKRPDNIKLIKIHRDGSIEDKLLKVNYTTVKKP